ncbi:hypothetical protein A7X92_13580 [Stenotrophomonas maltophilia]|nr:hypothetical protein A7X92_13580 [Stenotrophomonas maltophilia]
MAAPVLGTRVMLKVAIAPGGTGPGTGRLDDCQYAGLLLGMLSAYPPSGVHVVSPVFLIVTVATNGWPATTRLVDSEADTNSPELTGSGGALTVMTTGPLCSDRTISSPLRLRIPCAVSMY